MPVGVLGLVSSLWLMSVPFFICPLLLACYSDLLRMWREFSGLRMGEASVLYHPCQGDQECRVMPGLEGVLVCAPAVGPVCTRVCTCGCAR